MTLSFSTKWPERMGELAGQPNYFISKLYISFAKQIPEHQKKSVHEYHWDLHVHKLGKPWDCPDNPVSAKLHTIRSGNRWKAGLKIHPVINNRTPQRFQFAPTMICMGVQDIEIKYAFPHRYIFVDGVYISSWKKMNELAINDGFPSVEAFFAFFNQDFKGQLIHWTDLRY